MTVVTEPLIAAARAARPLVAAASVEEAERLIEHLWRESEQRKAAREGTRRGDRGPTPRCTVCNGFLATELAACRRCGYDPRTGFSG